MGLDTTYLRWRLLVQAHNDALTRQGVRPSKCAPPLANSATSLNSRFLFNVLPFAPALSTEVPQVTFDYPYERSSDPNA
jgi:hypothetical protein